MLLRMGERGDVQRKENGKLIIHFLSFINHRLFGTQNNTDDTALTPGEDE